MAKTLLVSYFHTLGFAFYVLLHTRFLTATKLRNPSIKKFEFSHPSCFLDNTTMIEHMKVKLIATGVYHLLENPHGSGKKQQLSNLQFKLSAITS